MSSGFHQLFEQWELAEAAATGAEARLARRLDAYCDGTAAAPSVAEIARAKCLRAGERELLRALQGHLAKERQSARLL